MYVMGWTIVPPNMLTDKAKHPGKDGIANFPPVDAMDCAAMRTGSGITVVRATKDANNNLHPISFSHLLSGESLVGAEGS